MTTRLTMIVCLCLILAPLPACELTPEQTAAVNTAIDESGPVIAQLEADLAAARERLATVEDDAVRAKAAKVVAETEKVLAEVKGVRETFLANRDAEGNIDTVGVGGDMATKVATRFLPPPWDVLASIAIGGIVMGVRANQNKRRAVAVVRAMEAAKKANPTLAAAFSDPTTARILDGMGDGAKALVDRAQSKGLMLPV